MTAATEGLRPCANSSASSWSSRCSRPASTRRGERDLPQVDRDLHGGARRDQPCPRPASAPTTRAAAPLAAPCLTMCGQRRLHHGRAVRRLRGAARATRSPATRPPARCPPPSVANLGDRDDSYWDWDGPRHDRRRARQRQPDLRRRRQRRHPRRHRLATCSIGQEGDDTLDGGPGDDYLEGVPCGGRGESSRTAATRTSAAAAATASPTRAAARTSG